MRRTGALWEVFVLRFEEAMERYRKRRLTADQAGELFGMSGRHFRLLLRRHDEDGGRTAPIHFVSAFRLVLAQEAVPDKPGELATIPLLLEWLGAGDSLKGALVRSTLLPPCPVAEAITAQGTHWCLQSRPTSQHSGPRSRPPSPPPKRSTPTPPSTRATAASRSAAWPCSDTDWPVGLRRGLPVKALQHQRKRQCRGAICASRLFAELVAPPPSNPSA